MENCLIGSKVLVLNVGISSATKTPRNGVFSDLGYLVEPEGVEPSTLRYQFSVLPLHHSPELPCGDSSPGLLSSYYFLTASSPCPFLKLSIFTGVIKQKILKNYATMIGYEFIYRHRRPS